MSTHDNCKATKQLVYRTDDELSVEEKIILSAHISTCSDCNSLRQNFLSVRNHLVSQKTNGLTYPDFAVPTQANQRAVSTLDQVIRVIRYTSTIAAALLAFLFISEQTISVRKITQLEKRIQLTNEIRETGRIDRIAQVRNVFTDEEWNRLASILNITVPTITSANIFTIKKLLVSSLHSENLNKPALSELIKSSVILQKNVIYLKTLTK